MTLSELNLLRRPDAQEALRECCGSTDWAYKLVAHRPFTSEEILLQEAEQIWWKLKPSDWLEAFSQHPQIGGREVTSEWSSQEQAGMNYANAALTRSMQNLNRRYFERFGWIFIVCATGKSAEEMHAILETRLANAPSDEIRVAAAEQVKIMQIRLQKLLR
jgi:OHCU decarboxylase